MSSAILGTLGAVVDLYDKADSVISRFRSYNPKIAPHELCRLYFLLLYLRERDAHVCAPADKLRHLKDLLQECESLIEEHDPEQTDRYGFVPYTWPKTAEIRLEALINAIDEELLRLKFYIPGQEDQESAGVWQKPSALASTGATKAREERRESLNFLELPVTITLRRHPDDDRGQHFLLKRVNIVERDSKSRTLQYQNEDGTVILSHRVTRGQLPFVEDKLDATKVNFYEPQKLVVQTDHYEAYKNIYPQYDFTKSSDLDIFIQKLRERDLMGKFLPDRIYPNKDERNPLARCKVVRLWTRDLLPSSQALGLQYQPEVTLTFENTMLNKKIELNLKSFSYPAQLTKKDCAVEILTGDAAGRRNQLEKITFLFQKKDRDCAKRFHEGINAHHPLAPRAPQIIEHKFEPWSTFSDSIVSRPESTKTPSLISETEPSTAAPSFVSKGPITPVFGPRKSFGSIYEKPTTRAPEQLNLSPRTMPKQRMDTPTYLSLDRTSPTVPPSSGLDFEIAVMCALTIEAEAVMAAFDHRWEGEYCSYNSDRTTYNYGSIGRHNVVLVYMAGLGKIHAANAASDCRHSFPGIKLCLVVGVCGGVPESPQGDKIWLGDVAISEGVVQYDYGRQYEGKFVLRSARSEKSASNQLTPLLNKLKGRHDRKCLQGAALRHLQVMNMDEEYAAIAKYPEQAEDVLFYSAYQHRHRTVDRCPHCEPGTEMAGQMCEVALRASCIDLKCDSTQVRRRRSNDQGPALPAVHFGNYGSGDAVMKSGKDRDEIAREIGIIAFEMEGAAAWESFQSCLVIKGICDYADSHKNKVYQNYAAATAAAYAKAFLEQWHHTY